jgi:hypothetical protein
MEEYNSWFRRAESEMREELLKRVKEELKNPTVVTEDKVIDVYPFDWDLYYIPTWALIEELKNRPGVTFRTNTTKEGLVGTFERAPAMVFTVKLPVNDEV